MKRNLLLPLVITLLLLAPVMGSAQCTITNATGCVCPNGAGDCDLLPDITISWYGLLNYAGGPTEFPQTGAGTDNGHLRVSGSTPNIGYGPFTVEAEDAVGNHMYICGTDTFTAPAAQTFTCPNGAVAKEMLWQRIYHKSGNNMTYRDRMAGAMTYDVGSLHVDDWGIMSLRIQNPLEPDPRRWDVIGWGHKQSFCLMDYGSCTTYNGHCRDNNTVYNQGTILLNGDFPNWGLGNNYGCSSVEQGCSVGYTDIYSESLNGMFIEIPPGTCNGDYWIVYEIDPHNYFQEMNETNNFTAVPFTLTLQNAPGNPSATISASRNPVVCGNDSVRLTANAGLNYLWSNGATTQSILAGSGIYTVRVTDYCGTATSAPLAVAGLSAPARPDVTDDTVCSGFSASLYATGNDLTWYDNNNVAVGTGNSFTTPILTATAHYTVQDRIIHPGTVAHCGKADSTSSGAYFTGTNYLTFDALKPLVLKSVKVYSNAAGGRTIQLANSSGVVVASGTFNVPAGSSRVNLNFDVPAGTNWRLIAAGTPNLWRNNAGVTYPYTITDTLSITGSSAGATYYYFFYDWEIEVGGGSCVSIPAAANAVVTSCTGIDPAADLSKNFTIYPNPSEGVFILDMTIPGAGSGLEISVYDLTGRRVHFLEIPEITGKHLETIDLSAMSKGIYSISIVIEGRKYIRKMTIL